MGYKVERKTYVLVFEDRDGMEVRVRSLPIGEFLGLAKLADLRGKRSLTPEEIATVNGLFGLLADSLVSWNLEEDDGAPIPPTVDGVKSLDPDLAMEIFMAWLDAVASVSVPKGSRSNGGSPSVEPSIPMEVLSASPPN